MLAQSENPSMPSRLAQETVKVLTYTLSPGSRTWVINPTPNVTNGHQTTLQKFFPPKLISSPFDI
jgi:hypothetical protein